MATKTVTLTSSEATYIDSTKPSTRLATAAKAKMRVALNSAIPITNFGLPRGYRGQSIPTSVLSFRTLTAWTSVTVTVQRAARPKGDSMANRTWNNDTGVYPGSVAVTGALKAGSTVRWEFDVASEMQKVANGDDFWGWRVMVSSAAGSRYIYGRGSAFPPTLTMTLVDETPAPFSIGPSGVVSVPGPVFVWDAPDDISKVRMQVDYVDGSFSAPIVDSGDITSGIGQVNSAAYGIAMPANSSFDFRFRQTGPRGPSAWSDPVTVTRTLMGTLSVVAPAVGGTVKDPTPEHAWTFANQGKYHLWISTAAGDVWYDSKLSDGADQTLNPTVDPKLNLVVPDLAVMTSHLETYDTLNRIASPGDPGYAYAEWSWTVVADGTTAGPDSVSAHTEAGSPGARIDITRASGAPDEWLLIRDGMIVARFDGGDFETSFGHWSWYDWTATPNDTHTWGVAAIVAGKASARMATSSLFVPVDGLWVVDVDTGVRIMVSGEGVTDGLEYGGTSAIYTPAYSDRSVKKTTSLRGIEGTVTGYLRKWPTGRDVDDQTSDAMTIRSQPSELFQVIYGDTTFPALITDMSPVVDGSARRGEMVKRVSFRVDQVGGLPAVLS